MHGQWTTHSTPSYKYLMLNQFCCRECIRPHQNNPKLLPIVNMEQKDPWQQGSWGQHGAHMGPTGPRWAPCWPHELCYLGIPFSQYVTCIRNSSFKSAMKTIYKTDPIICPKETCKTFWYYASKFDNLSKAENLLHLDNAAEISKCQLLNDTIILPDSKIHGAIMRPTWVRQDPGGPHVGPIYFAIWASNDWICLKFLFQTLSNLCNTAMVKHKPRHLFMMHKG